MMRKNGEFFDEFIELARQIPDGIWFGPDSVEKKLNFQAETQDDVKLIRRAFPGTWRKEFDKNLNWWEYETERGGWTLGIYGVSEAPATCRPIWEEKEVEENVPVKFEKRRVMVRRIVGYDCGPVTES